MASVLSLPPRSYICIYRKGYVPNSTDVKLIVSVILFCLNTSVQSQVKFYTVLSQQSVGYQQTFQVQYIIEGARKIENFKTGKLPDFNIHNDFDIPFTSTVNSQTGQVSDSYSRIIVVSAKKVGKLTVNGATAVIDGKVMRSNPVTVIVRKSGLSSAGDPLESLDESELRPGENIEEKISKNFFLKAEVNKKTCFIGEPLMAVYKAYTRLNANSQVVKRPSLTGFSVTEMVDSYDNRAEIEVVDGRSYYAHVIRKVQLFPLQPGIFQLDPAEIESVIHFVKIREDSGSTDELQRLLEQPDIDEPAFTMIDHKATIKSKPVNIEVKALPEAGQPADFSGAVGQFAVVLRVIKDKLQRGEPGKLQVILSGKGNFPLITTPAIEWPKGVEVADPLVKEDVNRYNFPLQGDKTFEYTFSAKDTGSYSIPAVHFTYFDPSTKKYVRRESSKVEFEVTPGMYVAPKPMVVDRIELVNHNKPTRYYAFAIVAAGILGSIIFLLASGWSKKKAAVIESKPAPVKDIFSDPFIPAQQALYKGDKKKFYNEIQFVLWRAVAEKCNVSPSALNKENITFQLRRCSIDETVIGELRYLLNECEWALYTPSTDEKDMTKILLSARDVLNHLQP